MSFQIYLKEIKETTESQLEKGIKVESEHKDLYNYFKRFLSEKDIEIPLSEKEFFGYITKAHLREIKDYYDRLEKMEKGECSCH